AMSRFRDPLTARGSRPLSRPSPRHDVLARLGQRGVFVRDQIRRCRRLRPRHGNRRSRHGERIAKTRKSENAKKAQGQRSPSWSRSEERRVGKERRRALTSDAWNERRDTPTVSANVSISTAK